MLECRLAHTVELGLHAQFIGEILDVKAEEAVLEAGLVAIKKMNPLVFTPDTQSYYGIGQVCGAGFLGGQDPLTRMASTGPDTYERIPRQDEGNSV